MDLNKFTEKSRAALTEAQAIGTRHQHQAVDVEHLGLALLEQEEGLVPRLLQKAGVSPDLVKEKLQEALDRIPRISGDTMPLLHRGEVRARRGLFFERIQ